MKSFLLLKRSLAVIGGVFLTFMIVGFLRGLSLAEELGEASLWTAIVGAIFLVSRIYRSFRGFDGELWGATPAELSEDRYRLQ